MPRIVLAVAIAIAAVRVSGAQIVSERNQHEALQHYRAGEQLLQAERFEDAEREFREAVKLDPLLHLAHYGLGHLFMLTKRFPLAVLSYTEAKEAFRTTAAQALQDHLVYERQMDDQIRALEDLKRAFDPNLRSSPGRPGGVDPNAALQRIDSQINQLRNQRRRGPDRPADIPAFITLALGSAYFRTDKIVDAEREYREAIRVEPNVGEAHNNLAVVLMLTRRYDDAEEEIRKAEKAGFRVNPQLKSDIKERKKNPS